VRDKVEGWLYLPPFQYRNEIGPMKRLFAPLAEACVVARCGLLLPSDIFSRYEVVVVLGDGSLDSGTTFMMNEWFYAAIQWVEQTRQELSAEVDEADKLGKPGRGIFSDRVVHATLMYDQFGFKPHYIMQTPHTLDEDVRGVLLDAVSVINCHALGDPESVKTMGQIMGLPNLDPDRVHHYTESLRQLNDGWDTVTITEEFPKRDSMMLQTKTRKALVNRYTTQVERTPHYEALADQIRQVEQEITTLGKRERFVRSGGTAWKEKVRTLRDPYLWKEISDRRVDEFLEQILERPEFAPARIPKPKGKPWVRAKRSEKK
jgi:hypothetical protein